MPGDTGWHPANTDPLDQLPALTDGGGVRPSGLSGLLNDFPGVGVPAKRIQFDLGGPQDIAQINVFTGNVGQDGRVYSTTVVNWSSDGLVYGMLGDFQSDPSGTINSGQWGSTLVEIFDDGGASLLTDVAFLRFDFYSVDNTSGQMRDPFDGLNPFTGVDDGHTAAFVSPQVYEIDVVGLRSVPEPSVLILMGLGLAGLSFIRRRTTDPSILFPPGSRPR